MLNVSVSSLASVYDQLTNFANLSNFWSLFDTAFGSNYDFATAVSLKSQWQSGSFSQWVRPLFDKRRYNQFPTENPY